MLIDRTLQRQILQALADVYPDLGTKALGALKQLAKEDVVIGNLLYLEEHGLIVSGVTRQFSGFLINGGHLKITAKGLDFLSDDGGLSAILGVVTIKLHDDTIKSLIEAKILDADLPDPDKRKYLDALRELPAESTKHLAMKLIDAGLENAPVAWTAIKSVLSTVL